MRRHTRIRVIAVLISVLVLVPMIPAITVAANQDVTPMHAVHQKGDSSQMTQGCLDIACVSFGSCESQCNVSCSVTLGIFSYTFGSHNLTGSNTAVRTVTPYTLITLASDERPPI
ncbi:MAG: hypothetical protein ACC641_08425 [Acidiferrobacterales bacterium]